MVFLDSTHTYSLTATTPTYWNITNIPATHTVTPLTQSTSALDFGMYATPNIHDVAVTSWSSNLPWPNASVHFYVTYHNNGTVVESDTLYFNADSLLHFVSASPAPSFTNGNTFAWVYSNLQLQEYRNIQLHFQADTSITQLDTLHSNILIQPLVGDALQSNNTQQIVQRCLSSFDPNDKAVAPSGAVLNTQLLEYTIRFQNTGTAPAANVFVVDDIDPNADLSTFQFLGASHPVTYSISGAGHIVFTFANINLPDSNSNEPLSHGLLRYSIYPRAGLAVGSTILNTAAIRFDFNSPVITNTTTTTIKSADVGGIISASNKSLETLVVFPNPAMDEIKVQNLGASLTLLTIYDVNGSIVLQEKLKEQAAQFLNISQLVPGVYLVSATSKSGTIQQVKLVKAAR
jgi:uncharacterized repeat protein (TIGR01451 family)